MAKFGKAVYLFNFAGFFQRNSIVPIDCLVVDYLRLSSESPKSGKARRSHSMRSRGSKSFRFLQIISAANKQYTGARAPDRQQAAEPTAALATCIPLRCFAASLYSQRLLLIVISQQLLQFSYCSLAGDIISVLLVASQLSL